MTLPNKIISPKSSGRSPKKRTVSVSAELFQRALRSIPGGVNSPVRAFRAVGGEPFFVERAEGAYLWDVDGNRYLDYVGSWGPAILGHAHPKVIGAIQSAAAKGTSFGVSNPLEVELAEKICRAVPGIDRIRFCNSGTEATMSAIRLARGFTGRDKIIKFEGCYHGHADYLLVKAGSGALTFGHPDSAGVPRAFAEQTVVLPFNEPDLLREAFKKEGNSLAAVIVEPVPGNAGLYLPKPGYLETMLETCQAHGALLIFDEVMTGFRLGPAGAQGVFGIRPDLTCFGKIIGGGLPVGAFGGRAEVMDLVAPVGPVYQAGTLSGNPCAMAAGLATLEELSRPGSYARLETLGRLLEDGMREAGRRSKVAVQFNRIGSMFCGYFTGGPVHNLEEALRSDRARFAKFFHQMLEAGIYFAPSQFEAGFLSLAHTEEDIERTVKTAGEVLRAL